MYVCMCVYRSSNLSTSCTLHAYIYTYIHTLCVHARLVLYERNVDLHTYMHTHIHTHIHSMRPSRLPTRLVLYGRNVDLLPSVTLRIANVPQHLTKSDITVVFGTSTSIEATVLSVEHIATCAVGETSDCNRTAVTFRSVPVTSPVTWAVRVSGKGDTLLDFTAEFFAPCDYGAFCGESRLTADTKILQVLCLCVCDCALCIHLCF